MKLIDPANLWSLNDFSLACTFPMPLTGLSTSYGFLCKGFQWFGSIFLIFFFVFPKSAECHANGTMTALALKVESVPDLVLSQLTLREQSCKPIFTNERFAAFSFPVNSCGTTRTVSWPSFSLRRTFIVFAMYLTPCMTPCTVLGWHDGVSK